MSSAAKKEFDEAYKTAISHWSSYLTEAEKDLQMVLGDQWSAAMRAYLKQRRREAYVFNKLHRVVKLIAGFQRKNRLSLKFDALLGGDSMTASQYTKAVMWHMQWAGGYQEMSDAFEKGALITGLNLVHLYVDRFQDPINGDIKFARCPFNSFLIDPNTTRRDLSDCTYILRRKYLSKEQIKALMPWAEKDIDRLKPPTGSDEKFPNLKPIGGGKYYHYDEFWRADTKKVYLAVLPDGNYKQFEKEDEIKKLVQMMPQLSGLIRTITAYKRQIKLQIFVQEEKLFDDVSPWLSDSYPFVAVFGQFTPEEKKAEYKIQGLIRVGRDPQQEVNKRRSQMVDLLESTITSGWKAKENKIVDPSSLYQSGQGLVVWLKETADMTDAERLQPPQIPAGLFQLSEIFDKDVYENIGANAELLGTPENENLQVAGILAKLRQGSGLTILQDVFDNYRAAKKQLGVKLLQMIQENYSPMKVQQLIGEPPTPAFFSKDYAKYQCAPTEGILTDSQRQMYFSQLVALKQMGAPIPWSALLDAAPIQNKEELMRYIQQAEQQQAQEAQVSNELEGLLKQSTIAKMMEDTAQARERTTQMEENRANALLDRIKAIKEIENMDIEKLKGLADVIQKFDTSAKQQNLRLITKR